MLNVAQIICEHLCDPTYRDTVCLRQVAESIAFAFGGYHNGSGIVLMNGQRDLIANRHSLVFD